MISGGTQEVVTQRAIKFWCSGFLKNYKEADDKTNCPKDVRAIITSAYTEITDPQQRDNLEEYLKDWMSQPLETCEFEAGMTKDGYNKTTGPKVAACTDEYKSGKRKLEPPNLNLSNQPATLLAFGKDGYVPWAVFMVKRGQTCTAEECAKLAASADALAQRAQARLGATVSMKLEGVQPPPAVMYGAQLEMPKLIWQSDDARLAVGGRLMGGAITRLGDHFENDRTFFFAEAGPSVEWAVHMDKKASVNLAIAGVLTYVGKEDLGGGGVFGLRVDPKNFPIGVGADFKVAYIQRDWLPCAGAYFYVPF